MVGKQKIKIDKKRHLLKAITWRLIASVITFSIAWIWTGNLEFGLGIGTLDFLVKFVAYYYHERLWYKSKYGIKHYEKK